MSSVAKYKKYDSITEDIISTIRNSYLGTPVDEEFLQDLKLFLENKMVATESISPETFIPKSSDSSNKQCFDPEDFKCLQTLPNEILVKIFSYFDIKQVSDILLYFCSFIYFHLLLVQISELYPSAFLIK